jgi:hypothetical protein
LVLQRLKMQEIFEISNLKSGFSFVIWYNGIEFIWKRKNDEN